MVNTLINSSLIDHSIEHYSVVVDEIVVEKDKNKMLMKRKLTPETEDVVMLTTI